MFCLVLVCITAFAAFGQTSAIRDYVGMISQTFHPDIVSFMQGFQEELFRLGHGAAARSIDHFLKGDSGTGFVYVAADGKNYMITNYHVISQAHSLSVTFEKTDGEQSKFSDLAIVAADEELDIAILTFAGGQNPFRQGLAFLNRAVQEGDDVYSAGFPGLGTVMIWQLGRGMVSNASVRLPDADNPGKTFGPFIQHTAQVDPGNSGGPLLVQTQGVPTGFAVAGINTLSARFRQAANYSIPMNRVQAFLDAALRPKTGTDLEGLNSRIDSFIEGIDDAKAVYPHINKFLSNACTGENAEYALSDMIDKAPRSVRNDIFQTFANSPVEGMSLAVAWTIENAMRSRSGKIAAAKNTVVAIDDNNYAVSLNVNDKIVESEWTNEYGIWRIRTFGDFAAGDKSLIKKKAAQRETDARLHADPSVQIGGGLALYLDRDPVKLNRDLGFAMDLIIRGTWAGWGMHINVAKEFFQVDGTFGAYVPIIAGPVAFTPFANFGIGFQVLTNVEVFDPLYENETFLLFFAFPFQTGFQFTTAAVPGLYFQFAYRHNIIIDFMESKKGTKAPKDENLLIFSLGYAF